MNIVNNYEKVQELEKEITKLKNQMFVIKKMLNIKERRFEKIHRKIDDDNLYFKIQDIWYSNYDKAYKGFEEEDWDSNFMECEDPCYENSDE